MTTMQTEPKVGENKKCADSQPVEVPAKEMPSSTFSKAKRRPSLTDRLSLLSRQPSVEEEHSSMFRCAVNGDRKSLEAALLKVTDEAVINKKFEDYSNTMLIAAASNGDIEGVKLLLKYGSDKDA